MLKSMINPDLSGKTRLTKGIILFLGLSLFFSSLIFAGPNENAGIVFDLDATTYGNQNLTGIPSQPAGTYIRVDVYCTGVQNLDTYEFEVIYDPTELTYVAATATNPITFEGNILESNGGTALGWMIDTSTPGVLSLAYTLAGTDTLEAPEGEGLIADIVFQSLVATHGTLSFGDVLFIDSFGVMDIITDKGIAKLYEFGNIDGTVTNSNTSVPIEGAIVSIGDFSDTTGTDGTYLLEYIPLGIHDITCTAEGYYDTVDVVEVFEDQNVTVDFVLEPLPRGTLDGIVTDANNGETIEDALITATCQGKVEYTGFTNADGYYIIDSLLASEIVGNYLVTCNAGIPYTLGEVANIGIIEDVTTTVDFVLPAPIMVVNPLEIFPVVENIGELTITYITVSNIGTAPLDWRGSIVEPEQLREQLKIEFPTPPAVIAPDYAEPSLGFAPEIIHTNHSELEPVVNLTRGSTGWAYDAYPGEYFYSFDTDDPVTANIINSSPNWKAFTGDFDSGLDDATYCIIKYPANIFARVDKETGIATDIGPIIGSGGYTWTGISCDKSTGIMYAVESNINFTNLWTIDLATGTPTLIGATGIPCVIDIAVDGEGIIWGYDIVDDNMYTIDKTTGVGTMVGPIGFMANYAQGMSWDPETDQVYLTACGPWWGTFRVLDRETGYCAYVGPLPGFPGNDEVCALGFIGGPWITVEPTSGTIEPGGEEIVQATVYWSEKFFPGQVKYADIVFTPDPNCGEQTVNVQATFGPPPEYGALEGIVTDGYTNPIEGAIITAIGNIHPLEPYCDTTNDTGYYEIDPIIAQFYNFTCEAEGFITFTDTFTVLPGETYVEDVIMGNPEISVEPESYEVTLAPETQTIRFITVYNDGNAPLEWNSSIEQLGVDLLTNKFEGVTAPSMNAEVDPNQTTPYNPPTRDLWDILFAYDVSTPTSSFGFAGAEFGNGYFLVAEWGHTSRNVFKLDVDGNYISYWNPTWMTGSLNEGLRDMTFDGEYFYGSNHASTLYNTIYSFDEDGNLQGTINSPVEVWSIAYDEVNDAFWVNNLVNNISEDLKLIDRSGNVLNTISSPPSMYGCAYDNISEGGPYLWIFTGVGNCPGDGCQIEQYNLNTLTLTGVTHSVSGDFPAATATFAGGLFTSGDVVPGRWVLGGLLQGHPPAILFGYDLGPYPTWLKIEPTSGFVLPGESQQVTATFNSLDFPVGTDTTANIHFFSTPDVGNPIIPVTLIVGTPSYGTLDGYVKKASDLTPIEGAVVTATSVGDIEYQDTTNSDGYYIIPEIQEDTYNVSCFAEGYNIPATQTAVIVEDETTTANFTLTQPTMDITPTSISETVPLDEPLAIDIHIVNNGDGELAWDASIELNRGVETDYSNCTTGILEAKNGQANGGNGSNGFVAEENFKDDVVTLHYDGPNNDCIGLTGGGTFMVAARFTPTELGDYYGDYQLSNVEIFIYDMPTSVTLKVWEGGSMGDPGNEIYSEDITGQISPYSWATIILSAPIDLVSDNEYWVGYEVTHYAGSYPAGCDAGPAVDEKGDWTWIYLAPGSWYEIQNLGLDFNWNIRAVLSPGVTPWITLTHNSGIVAAGGDATVTVYFNTIDHTIGEILQATIDFVSTPDVGTTSIPVTIIVGTPAYGTLEGYVKKASDLTPIEGAIVTATSVGDVEYQDTTNSDGYYIIPEIQEYTYNVSCFAAGYNIPATQTAVIVGDETTTVNFNLTQPTMDITPASISETVPPDEPLAIDIHIVNNGDGELEWDAIIIEPDRGVETDYSNCTLGGILEVKNVQANDAGNGSNGLNSKDDVILHYDGPNVNAIGLISGGIFMVAVRFTPTELGDYYCYYQLSSVEIFIDDMPTSATLKVWKGGSMGDPGTEIYSEDITGQISQQSWATIILSAPIDLVSDNEYWVGYEVTHNAGLYPAGCDAGPAVDEKGDWIYLAPGPWDELQNVAPTLDYNWNIRAVLSPRITPWWITLTHNSGIVAAGGDSTVTVYFNTIEHTIGDTLHATIDFVSTPDVGATSIPVAITVGDIGVTGEPEILVTELYGNFPNPFSSSTVIKFSLKEATHVKLSVYNIRGQLVNRLIDQDMVAGADYQVKWDGASNDKKLANGIYFYKLEISNKTFLKKMILMR